MSGRHLPVLMEQRASSLRADGTREPIHPADVSGRFMTARRVSFAALILFFTVLPWVSVHGHPAVLLDFVHREFHLFGKAFNAQDTPLLFFLLTGVAFSIAYSTVLLGRVWCGWVCPQTVWLEAVYRPIERLTMGSRDKRLRFLRGGWTPERVARTVVKHALYAVVSVVIAHIFASYFVGVAKLLAMVREGPAAHPSAFGTVLFFTGALYGNFFWFREQLCLVVCPYGRLQSVFTDSDSITVGYDAKRGEPRGKSHGKKKDDGVGDCVDCNRCVVVCPTGIDIRNGTQLDCIGCSQCIDACDEVMDKLGRPRGLIRYDSLAGLQGEPRRILRPRVYVYAVLMVIGAVVASIAFRARTDFEANLLRQQGAPYLLEGTQVRNSFTLHLVNKTQARAVLLVEPQAPAGVTVIAPLREVALEELGSAEVPVFITAPRGFMGGDFRVPIRVHRRGGAPSETKVLSAPFLGPGR